MSRSESLNRAIRKYQKKVRMVSIGFGPNDDLYEWIISHKMPTATFIREVLKEARRQGR